MEDCLIGKISKLGAAVPAALALWLVGAVDPVLAQGQAALVRVDQVRTEPLSQTVPVLGRLVARQAGFVAARINGPVASFLVEVGDRITADQVIAVLNGEALKARRDLAAGELAVVRAEHATKKAELALVRQQLKRMEGLKTSAAFNQARFEDASQQVAIARAELMEAESRVVSARADLRLAEINLYNIEIRALYDGVVSQRLTETGSYVQVGEPVVCMIADGSLEIEADVPYQRLTGLDPGTQLRVTLDDGSEHRAAVRAIVPEENPLTRTRAVRFVPRFSDIGRPLAADQSVTVHIPVGPARSVLTVHKDAIIKRGSKNLVFVAVEDNVEQREIAVGEAVGSRYEVLDGLQQGDQVVVRGNERLRPGDKVRVDGAS
jgi:RND family efflux transporter MFP subunit